MNTFALLPGSYTPPTRNDATPKFRINKGTELTPVWENLIVAVDEGQDIEEIAEDALWKRSTNSIRTKSTVVLADLTNSLEVTGAVCKCCCKSS